MSLSPELRKLVIENGGKIGSINDRPKGIIPFKPIEWNQRDEIVFRVAEMISYAAQGPGMHASDLAEEIVDFVEGAA